MNSDRKMYRKTYLEVDLNVLKANFLFLRDKAKNKWFCPMVKANAYGHGVIEVVRALVEVGQKVFGVALIEEAIELREAGFQNIQILVFSSIDVNSADAIDKYGLTPVITQKREISILENALQKRVNVHLKMNTGMNRLGISSDEILECIEQLKNSKQMKLVGLCTHLSHGKGFDFSKEQISKLVEISKGAGIPLHMLNSLAFWSHCSDLNHDSGFGFRPGISLYGLSPEGERIDGLTPVMSLKSEIVQCHQINRGEGVSYGWTWRAERPSLIGVIPIGYADGFSRNLSNKASVLVNNQRVSQVGTICMDYLMVDLTDIFTGSEEAVGRSVDIFGGWRSNGVSVQDWAEGSGTISYEILSRMGQRVPRKYI